jgi:hypothetical protein
MKFLNLGSAAVAASLLTAGASVRPIDISQPGDGGADGAEAKDRRRRQSLQPQGI